MHLQRVSLLETVGDNVTLRLLIQPVQFAAAMLATVECRKPLKTALKLKWNTTHAAHCNFSSSCYSSFCLMVLTVSTDHLYLSILCCPLNLLPAVLETCCPKSDGSSKASSVILFNTDYNEKALRDKQTLRIHCSKVEPKIFTLSGMQNGQNLISWRWSLPLPTNPVWWGSMHTISSYCGNRPTHKHTNKPTNTQTGPITIHCAAA